jgi:tight adherence protein C
MTAAWVGACVGLAIGFGITLTLLRTPWLRQVRLQDRLDPYLRNAATASRLLDRPAPLTPFPTAERILAPFLRDGAKTLERVLGGSASIRNRLDRAGRNMTLEQFRAEQMLWGAAGLLGGTAAGTALAARGAFRPVPLLILCLICAVVGVLARDHWLTREVHRREERMMTEFPTIAELLALAVAAGEGASGALERVTRISRGELSRELARALADARAGASLVVALEGISTRTGLPPLARFVDGVAIAVERGTPLADVLRAQAVDVREAGKRALLESGGRKEIAMMVPVVFLVLPVTVLFALFPGFFGFSFAG